MRRFPFVAAFWANLLIPGSLITACAASQAASTPASPPTHARSQHVFIVSFDGGKPAVMQQSAMPVTTSMAAEGAATWAASTVFPSITLVSHTSMLTGVGPLKHQILWNDYRPEMGFVKVATVFQLAHARGYSTAMFVGKEKFKHLAIPGTVDEFQVPASEAKTVALAAAKYILEKKPGLCFVHFADSDVAGHGKGWGSPEQIASFADEDAALGTLRDAVKRAGIEANSTFILTADHGGHDKTHGSASPEDMIIPWLSWGAGIKERFVITDAVNTCDTAATALALLGVAVPADFDGKPVISALK